ncbi:hypothetical protein HAP94_10945 [Acidithiobacillus ferrivorans]|nr:hypothetical protein [Acidithiobacillus ferrivorans]
MSNERLSRTDIITISTSLGLGFLSPALSLFFLTLWPRAADTIRRWIQIALVEKSLYLMIFLVGIIPVTMFVFTRPAPPDDLLKHLISGVYHFQYRTMFWGSPRLMAGDLYIGFDHVAALAYQYLPHHLAYLPFQLTLLIGLAAVLPLAILRQFANQPRSVAFVLTTILAAVTWMIPAFTERVASARPEDFFALWDLSVFLVRSKREAVIWAAAGLLLLPTYWIAFAYLPAALLLPVSRRLRISVLAVLSSTCLLFWEIYSNGQWLPWLWSLHTDIDMRVAGVAENQPAGLLLFKIAPMMLFIMVILIVYQSNFTKSRERLHWRNLLNTIIPENSESVSTSIALPTLLFAWFLLPDMIRYVDSLGPIAAVIIARMLNAIPPQTLKQLRPAANATALALLFLLTNNTFHPNPMSNLHIPGYRPGQKVLTFFSAATYDALYENPGIRVAPAMELGMTRRAVQRAGLQLEEGTVNCQELAKWHVAWLASPKMTWAANNAPNCLSLVRLDKSGMSLWAVRHAD